MTAIISLIGQVLAQLKTDLTTINCDMARSLNAIPKENEFPLPSIFIHYLDCPDVSPNETMQVVTQRIRIRFAIIVMARNYNQTTGIDELELTRDSIFSSIIGFEPTGYGPIEYVGGGIIPECYTGTILCWRDVFSTDKYLRSSQ